MRDTRDAVRAAILTFTKSQAAVTALVPAERHYPPLRPAKPEWPWIGYGIAQLSPRVLNGINGAYITTILHAYAKGGDEMAGQINAALAAAIDGPEGLGTLLPLTGPFAGNAMVSTTSSRVIQDGNDPKSWHGLLGLQAFVNT